MEMAQEAILVTGGASGIGLAVARGLLDAGRKVLVPMFRRRDWMKSGKWLRPAGWAACGWMCPTRPR